MSTMFYQTQQFDVGDLVELYDLDTRPLGSSTILYFSPSTYGTTQIEWMSHVYTPIDVESEGFEWSSTGSLPTPKLRISGSALVSPGVIATINTLLGSYDNLRGARITRWKTLKKYLDNEATTSDTTQYIHADVYVINQKTQHNRYLIEFELKAMLDFEGQKIPRRQVLKDFCTHTYREWDSSMSKWTFPMPTWSNTLKGTLCPYGGDAMFTVGGESTDEETLDVCGKRLSDCRLRFSQDPLPTTAFPMVGETSTT